eukprot:TRINITY_DN13190_c0_g1_i2.p1 TRINITY_DN13190_c0_g1~~TRINITY_DN13190_c0_g1_i2.p1  ORF type:complete len:705 (+),score=169.23 TRINITY_DN13190_c0_g1_i2:33-2117(+)
MAAKDDDKDILKAFEEDSDAFFDSLLSEAGLETKSAAKAGPAPKAAEFQPPPREKAAAPASATKAQVEPSFPAPAASEDLPSSGPAVFRMCDDNESGDIVDDSDDAFLQDCRPPEVPPPPSNFSPDDLTLREVLSEFYLSHRADNLLNVNSIVAKYRGPNVSNLWAQLSIKYGLPPVKGVELLSRTLYQSSPFEFEDRVRASQVAEAYAEASASATGRSELFQRAIARGAKDGNGDLLHLLSFRGVPEEPGLRAKVWKVLLGYTPMKRQDEWNAIQGEKRALYASYKSDLVILGDKHEVSLNQNGMSEVSSLEAEDLLLEVKNDVDRTRKDLEYFRRPATKASLLTLLFVYARLNPGIRYVQGMNEIAAVILYVLSVDAECAEADTFWCFSELMAEIKEGFMQAMDHSGEGVHGMVERITMLLRSYDPELARHLQKSELSLFVFVLRWCTVLFAQDATLPDVLRLWDSFLADPSRFEFLVHVCVAMILARRDELLSTEKQFALAEVIQSAPRIMDFETLLRQANAICAFERRGEQLPVFPPKRLQVVEDLSDWAQSAAVAASEAAAVATEVGSEVSKNIQEKIAPVVMERAGQASEVVQEKAQAVQAYWQETAPARQEALEQAQTQLSSLWASVRSKGQQLATEAATSEAAAGAAARLSEAADSAGSWFARASAAFTQGEEQFLTPQGKQPPAT